MAVRKLQLALEYLDVARSIAGRYRNRGVPQEDLEQVACIGLVKAARRYDPDRDVDFMSYAVPTIVGEVKRYFRDQAWMVRPPRRLQDLQAEISAAQSLLAQTLGRTPTLADVAEHLGHDVGEVLEALSAEGCFQPVSLETPINDHDTTLADVVGVDEPRFGAVETTVVLGRICRELPPRDRRILHLRFVRGLNQQQIGAELGVTQMQVSRLLTRILRDLRRAIDPVFAG